jgi:CBS domain-containing protein
MREKGSLVASLLKLDACASAGFRGTGNDCLKSEKRCCACRAFPRHKTCGRIAEGVQSGETPMKIADAMTRDVRVANPDQSIREAAQMMAELDAGALPVGEQDRLVGMITDRDIAIRAVAWGKAPTSLIREIMTKDVKYCFEDEEVDEVARNMANIQVRRLPVVTRDKRLVGIIAVGDIAAAGDRDAVSAAVSGISDPKW